MRKLVRCLSMFVVLLFCIAPLAHAADLAERNKDAAALYEKLSVLSKRDQAEAMARLTPEAAQEVWIANVKRVMAEHPELTVVQRSIFYEAIGLTSSGYGVIARTGTDEQKAAMKAASDYLLARARAVLPDAIVRAAFYELGPAEGRMPDMPRPGRPADVRAQWGECTCLADPFAHSCGMSGYCVSDGWSCIPTPTGCGYMGFDGCNGLCS